MARDMQGWRPTARAAGEWLVSFSGLAGVCLSLPAAGAAEDSATGKLEVLSDSGVGGAAATYGMGKQLLEALGKTGMTACA